MEFLNANENFLSMLKSSTRESFTADEIYIVRQCLFNFCIWKYKKTVLAHFKLILLYS